MKVRKGGSEEIPLIQGKRNPSKMVDVARGHQRADTLKPYSQKTSQSDHTRTTVAAAAKSLQSCPTLYDPIDGNPLGSSVPGILQVRILEWAAISFSNA